MKRKTNPTLIGAFVVLGLALLSITIIALAGNKLFTRKQRAVMHFSGSVYGLQVGAPVVFRGVRLGSVAAIEVVYDRGTDSFLIPVVAELDSAVVRGLDGHRADRDVDLALPALVQRGLTAQLSMQSLLTGQLYVDLDLRPQRQATLRGTYRDAVEIPTTATAIQALKNQLDTIDIKRITDDLSAIASSARTVVSGPELKQAMSDLMQVAANMRHVTERLDKHVDPLAGDLQRSMASARAALDRVGSAAERVDATAERLGRTSDRVGELIAPDAELVQSLQRAVGEVGRTATALRHATSGDSALMQGADHALKDLSRAARALRDLAETLEQQPESLLRGRKVTE